MACGCQGKKSKTTYVYKNTDGHEKIYQTLIEARAAQIRAGGGGKITETAKA